MRLARVGAGSQISLSRFPDLPPEDDVPPGTTGQLSRNVLVTLPREIAVHRIHPPELLPAEVDDPEVAGAIALTGIPVTHVIAPLAARIGALIVVFVVVVVMVMM